jgi:SAM-dependent methyltransferase
MTGEHETKTNLDGGPVPYQEQPVPAIAEVAYNQLTAYGFARRYVEGKVIIDIGGEGGGHGPRLLAQSAGSVTTVNGLPEVVELASAVFDVVVAFGVIEDLEHPGELVREAKRVLKQDGVLLVSAKDKLTNTIERSHREADGRREMYVPQLQEMLGRHFGHVQIYRQGVVAGGLVFPVSAEEVAGVPVEVGRFSLTDHNFSVGPPTTRSVIAVCSDAAQALGDEEQPYLLLDRDRRVFDECEERAEDVELLRAEIRRMQETEVQAFMEAIKIRRSLVRELLRSPYSYRNLILEEIRYRQSIIRGNMRAIRRKGAVGSTEGAFRRLSALYRRLRAGHKP